MARTAVFGIYSNLDQAEAAVEEIKREGFGKTDVSMLFPRSGGSDDFDFELDNQGFEGASAGAASGAILGCVLGWLIDTGAVAIPSLESYIGHGPILSVLSVAVACAILGGLTGGLAGMGISAYHSFWYNERVKGGRILLSVCCGDLEWTRRARNVLERTGGRDIVGGPDAEGAFARTDPTCVRST
jgi:hypothetical protein